MCYILMKWDYSILNNTNHFPTVIFNGKTYNPLELVTSDGLPSLDQFANLNKKTRKGFVLSCVDFALRSKEQLNWHNIHRDYKLWFSMLKLWFHTKMKNSYSSRMTLVALIISFLKHVLLDTYGETEERSSNGKALPKKPYCQYSHKILKSYFSWEQCYDLREGIKRYAQTFLPDILSSNEEIDGELQECQQLYKELSMINQFSGKPFDMPPPDFCLSGFTYPSAVRLSQSKHFRQNINTICSKNQLLVELIEEFYGFFYKKYFF